MFSRDSRLMQSEFIIMMLLRKRNSTIKTCVITARIRNAKRLMRFALYYLSCGETSLYFSSISLNLSASTGLIYCFSLSGYFFKRACGRVGRFSNPPPQLGQTFCRMFCTQSAQNVHSNVQIIALTLPSGSNLTQCSQMGFISSICCRFNIRLKRRYSPNASFTDFPSQHSGMLKLNM